MGQWNGKDVETKELVLTECPVPLHALKIPICRSYEAYVHRDLLHAADTTQGAFLQHPQDLGL